MTNLWQGMKSMAHKPVELMRDMAGKLRDFLPFSPAKVGPLKDLHKVRIMETIASGMKPAPMVDAMRAATAGVSSAASGRAGGPGGGSVHFAPVIHISGGGDAKGVRTMVDKALALSQEEFSRMMGQYTRQQGRRQFA